MGLHTVRPAHASFAPPPWDRPLSPTPGTFALHPPPTAAVPCARLKVDALMNPLGFQGDAACFVLGVGVLAAVVTVFVVMLALLLEFWLLLLMRGGPYTNLVSFSNAASIDILSLCHLCRSGEQGMTGVRGAGDVMVAENMS